MNIKEVLLTVDILPPVWFFVFSLALLFAHFFTRALTDKYEQALQPGCRIKAHQYQWESKEVWEKSFTMFSKLTLKITSVFLPISIIIFFLRFLLQTLRLYISLTALLFFITEITILLVKSIKIHKSFCKKGWFRSCYNNKKINGIAFLWII